MKKTMKLITKMKGLKAGEIIKVELDPTEDARWWFACPNCGSVNTENWSTVQLRNKKLNTRDTQYLHCSSCGGCGLDFEIHDNKVVER